LTYGPAQFALNLCSFHLRTSPLQDGGSPTGAAWS